MTKPLDQLVEDFVGRFSSARFEPTKWGPSRNYLTYFEMGRTELLREATGRSYRSEEQS